MNFVKLQTVS